MQGFFDATSNLSRIYRKIETCGKPWAAAINGACMGGGFELALACHHRVMADDDKTRVGLPEIKIGLFPGGGGTIRVSRLMPTPDALQMLLKGDQIKPAAAKAKNLVHALAPRAELVQKAKDWIKAGGKGVAPWDEKGWKAPSGKVFSPGGMMIWPPANAIYRRETFDNYPAAKAVLQCVYDGLQLPMDLALRVESRWFAKVLRSPEAAAMIRSLFVSMGELNKGARRPKNIPPTSIKKIGVLGAGFMGAGIAYVSALAGIEVVLIDRDQAAADKGKGHADKILATAVAKGRSNPQAKEQVLSRISPTADYGALAGVDLIVEAVFEDRAVKADATAKALAVVGPDAIFASNTSTLPITSLAENWPKPENFIGVHFFSPVDKMLLVETILGAKTGDRALAVALDFVRAIKKTPIVVHDSRGFFANRCVLNYIREGHIMLMEGVPAAMIENVARMAGMPVGPLSLNDEVALDLGWRILQATKADLGPQAVDPSQEKLLEEMVVKQERFGRKNSKGFYDYPARAPKTLWPGLEGLQTNETRSRYARHHRTETTHSRRAGGRSGAHGRGRRGDRSARGRCRLDHRLRLRALHRRRADLHRLHGDESFRRAVRQADGQIRRTLRGPRPAPRHGAEGRDFLWTVRGEKGRRVKPPNEGMRRGDVLDIAALQRSIAPAASLCRITPSEDER